MGRSKRIIGIEMDDRILANAAKRSGRYNGDLTSLVEEWASKTVAMLKKNVEKKGLVLTRELLDSLHFEFNEGSPPSISISFSGHGRYLEIKQLFWHKAPPYDVILDWVKKQGVSSFAYVPGYDKQGERALYGIDQNKAASRIAWGIVKDRASGEAVNQFGRWKRAKQWQNPSASKDGKTNLGTAIGHLRHLIEEEVSSLSENLLIYTLSE